MTPTPDANIFALIASCHEAWTTSAKLDALSLQQRRADRLSEAAQLTRRSRLAIDHAVQLERRVLRETEAETIAGHEAKFRFALGVSLDAEDFIAIAYQLGVEAGRLGLAPRLFEPEVLVAAAAA